MAFELYQELEKGNIDLLGDYLGIAWNKKKELEKSISNKSIDEIYSLALKNGTIGGKLLGAGGGGFLLFYVPLEYHERVRRALDFLRELDFKFDYEGTKMIYS